MSLSKPLQLLSLSSKGYEVVTNDISRILDKIGDKKVAIVSINGNKRTGKSFLLNYFLRYLKYQSTHGNEWVNGVNETTLNGFDWRGGTERHTVGIWMWSEPFMVKDKYGNDIALLLVDTQGNFDEKTTFQECSVIFSLSLLMSTTLILNIKCDLSEDKLQFVEFFTTFAESFSGESQSSGALFQKLVFLLRDWENEDDYQFGYHDQNSPIDKNYTKSVIFPNASQCLEAQNTRKEILRYFNEVSSFLMPHPGRLVSKTTFKGQNDYMEKDFIENIGNLVPKMLAIDNLEPKQIGGQLLTGNIFKQYLIKWAEVIRTQKIPEAKSLTAATAEVNYILALKHTLNMYHTDMNGFIETKPTDELLCSYHQTAKSKSLDYFLSEPKVRISEDRKSQMCDELITSIEKTFVILRTNNSHRIDKEDTEQKLNEAFATQLKMQFELEDNKRENWRKITDLQSKITDVQEESKVKQLEQEKRFKEETDRMRLNMDEQNSEHKKMLDDLERKHTQQRQEFVRNNNELMEQKIRQFEEQKRMIEEHSNKMERKMQNELEKQRRETERERENTQRLIEQERRNREKAEREIKEIRRETVTRSSDKDGTLVTLAKGIEQLFNPTKWFPIKF